MVDLRASITEAGSGSWVVGAHGSRSHQARPRRSTWPMGHDRVPTHRCTVTARSRCNAGICDSWHGSGYRMAVGVRQDRARRSEGEMQLPTASAVFALLAAGPVNAGWNLNHCQQSLNEAKAKAGHVCTIDHLRADATEILGTDAGTDKSDSLSVQRDRVTRDWAERGAAELFRVTATQAGRAAETVQTSRKATIQAVRDFWATVAFFTQDFPGDEMMAALLISQEYSKRNLAEVLASVPEATPEIFRSTPGAPADTLPRGVPEAALRMQAAALLRQCEQERGASEWWLCAGYVDGVADTLTGHRLSCPPGVVTYGQLESIVLKFLRDHPERLHENRLVLVEEALRGAFPCSPTPSR